MARAGGSGDIPEGADEKLSLSPEVLLSAYASGAFPMADLESGEITFYTADPRGIILLDTATTPRTVRQLLRRRTFEITFDQDFESVIRACAAQPRPGGWIDERLIAAYCRMHEVGVAHSVEARREGVLVGGLYGVHLRGAFFGESMFSRTDIGGSGASKACLAVLIDHLRACGLRLLDTQMWTPVVGMFGGIEISGREYETLLEEAMGMASSLRLRDARDGDRD